MPLQREPPRYRTPMLTKRLLKDKIDDKNLKLGRQDKSRNLAPVYLKNFKACNTPMRNMSRIKIDQLLNEKD